MYNNFHFQQELHLFSNIQSLTTKCILFSTHIKTETEINVVKFYTSILEKL